MTEKESQVAVKRSWIDAFRQFMKAEGFSLGSKIVLRYFPALFIPFGLINDSTGIGVVDDPLTLAFAVYVIWQINKYRNPNKF